MFLNAKRVGLVTALILLWTPVAMADPGHEGPETTAAAAAKTLPMVAGEVTKVDTDQGKLSIKHGAIPNLGMDPMTMVFKAADPAMLKDLKAGDKINFTADKVNGQLTATKVEKAK